MQHVKDEFCDSFVSLEVAYFHDYLSIETRACNKCVILATLC